MTENPSLIFDLSEFRQQLKTARLGHPTEYFPRVKSTSDRILEMARRGAPEGTLVVAEEQTAGRGRQGAVWHSPPGCGIWASVLLRPRNVPIDQMPPLSMCAAYAVTKAIEEVAEVSSKIKWPNDVLVNNQKVAGFMIETKTVPGVTDEGPCVILGMGINVNQSADQFPPELQKTAGSLMSITGKSISRPLLLQRILEHFEPIYGTFVESGFTSLLNEIKSRLAWRGHLVELSDGDYSVQGHVLDVESDGSLVLDTVDEGWVVMYTGSLRFLR